MGRRILAIAAAAVIALIGAVLVLLYARGADSRAVAAASPTTVYVSNAVVPAGTSLKEALRLQEITETKVAARSLPAGALTTVDDSNSALVALADIAPGQYVLSAAFGETPLGEKALQVGAGKLAVSVQLSDPARVGTFVTAGSYLTVFMTYKMKQLDTSEAAKVFNDQDVKGTSVLLDNIKVIAMGDATLTPPATTATEGDAQQPAAPSFLVTLEVTPEQAVRLVHGINNYTLYAGLRGSELKVNPNLAVNDLSMLGGVTK
jgi:pilus assembly protein CpaB